MMTMPTPEQVRERLSAMNYTQIMLLSELTDVPFTTLWKVRNGDTQNPRLATVCAIWDELVKSPKGKRLKISQEPKGIKP